MLYYDFSVSKEICIWQIHPFEAHVLITDWTKSGTDACVSPSDKASNHIFQPGLLNVSTNITKYRNMMHMVPQKNPQKSISMCAVKVRQWNAGKHHRKPIAALKWDTVGSNSDHPPAKYRITDALFLRKKKTLSASLLLSFRGQTLDFMTWLRFCKYLPSGDSLTPMLSAINRINNVL